MNGISAHHASPAAAPNPPLAARVTAGTANTADVTANPNAVDKARNPHSTVNPVAAPAEPVLLP